MRRSVELAGVSWKPRGRATRRWTKALQTLTVCFDCRGYEERSGSFLSAVSGPEGLCQACSQGMPEGTLRMLAATMCREYPRAPRAYASRVPTFRAESALAHISLMQPLPASRLFASQTVLSVLVSVFHSTLALGSLCYMGCS